MSHAALLSGRYDSVLYNDINSLVVELVKQAINGEYNYERFKPKFITREEFYRLKNISGYVKFCWSFGSGGTSYLYGRHLEAAKKAAHNFIVFGEWDGTLDKSFLRTVTAKDISERRKQFTHHAKCALKGRNEWQELAHLQRLERLQHLDNLEITNTSYADYTYQDGDVVYCDIPYEGAAGYGGEFDHKAFYDWAAAREHAVYFSSYKISDKRFKIIWAKRKRITRGLDNSKASIECLYYNGK